MVILCVGVRTHKNAKEEKQMERKLEEDTHTLREEH